MCVLVRTAAISPCSPRWDRDRISIIVSDQLTTGQALLQIRAMLERLGAVQCQTGATCWCGDPVTLPGLSIAWRPRYASLVPRQRSAAHAGRTRHGA